MPYIVHPLRVSTLLIEIGAADSLAIAGVLHDTVEDTDTTLDRIERLFGADVGTLVDAVTEPDRNAPWEERKSGTIEMLGNASQDVLLLACADKLDNIRSMGRGESLLGNSFWDRFSQPRERQARYYRDVAATIEARASCSTITAMMSELRAEVEQLFPIR